VTETPGQATERVYRETRDWDQAAEAAVNAKVQGLLSSVGVTMDEVTTAVTSVLEKNDDDHG